MVLFHRYIINYFIYFVIFFYYFILFLLYYFIFTLNFSKMWFTGNTGVIRDRQGPEPTSWAPTYLSSTPKPFFTPETPSDLLLSFSRVTRTVPKIKNVIEGVRVRVNGLNNTNLRPVETQVYVSVRGRRGNETGVTVLKSKNCCDVTKRGISDTGESPCTL